MQNNIQQIRFLTTFSFSLSLPPALHSLLALSLYCFSPFFPLSAVPTFASFLKEVDSPYEVHDYVRAYLGDTPQAKDFAKQFLERRAKQNANQQKSLQGQQSKNQQVCAAVSRCALFKEFTIRWW